MPGTLATRIYSRLPVPLQHLVISAQGLNYRLRRADTRTMRDHYHFLLGSQWWAPEVFRRHQAEQLRALLKEAFAHVPHYRRLAQEMGCSYRDFQSVEDVRRLPVLEKEDVRGREDAFISERFEKRKLYHGHTSGTTGTPLHTYETKRSFSLRWAYVARLRYWAGVADPIYPRRVQFTGREIVPDAQAKSTEVYWRHNLPGNALLFSTTHLTPETVPRYAEAMRAFKPELIDAYPSALLIMARVARRKGTSLPRPQAIIATAETLTAEHRAEIEEAFGTHVYDQYAASEPSCVWAECEAGTMHMSPEYGLGEIIKEDGQPAAPGEKGEVVVTSFLNPAMPLIRYRVGDLAVAGAEAPCPCGRQMPRVQAVVGRRDDILYVPERGYIGRLDPVFKGLHHLLEAQIIQEKLDLIRILVVPAAAYDENEEATLLKNVRAKVGQEVRVKIEKTDHIPRGANGKFRSVVSEVKHLYPDQL